MTTDEPTRIGDIARTALATGTPPPGPTPDAPDEVEVHRRQLRAESWARIIPPVYGDPTIDGLRAGGVPPAIVDDLVAWAADPTRNLVLIGPVGVGKTYAAWAAMRRVYGTGHDVHATGVVDLLDALRPSTDDTASVARLRDVDILLLDDLGAERPTDWTGERLYALIHHRWEHRRPIIATTNLDTPDLRDVLGERTYSRLVGGALVLDFGDGPDRRRETP